VFSHLGWGELLVLAVVGLLIFGPDRLPKAVADAVRAARQLRALARGAADDLKAELGPEMADLDLASLHPRRIVGSLLDDDAPGVAAPTPVRRPAALVADEPAPYDVDAT
jgi:sec-independent protein translocase protein TatB